MYPFYLKLYLNHELEIMTKKALSLLESCCLCPRRCGVNRLKNELGYCQTGRLARIYSYMPHLGEEPGISGQSGSGTVFFSGCNMTCVYCQNFEFSQLNQGREVESNSLAQIMLELQELNCHNINLVTPTHVMPQILEALLLAIPKGFRLPLVYNSGGYELVESLKLLEGIIDIYLPDMRYAQSQMSIKYSDAPDYPENNQPAIKEMLRQVGPTQINQQGVITRGLIIRHLVLPNNIAQTEKIMYFISREIHPQTYISLMSQFFPCYKANEYPELNRCISESEYGEAEDSMLKEGLSNGWIQESRGLKRFAGINIKPR